jgi:oligosaccharide repeat unit polymerase
MEMFCVVFNAILYILFLLYCWWKRPNFNGTFLVVLIWTFSAFASVLYFETNNSYITKHEITFFPFILLFLLFVISVYPLLKFDSYKITRIDCRSYLIYYYIYVIAIISTLPFIEMFIHLFASDKIEMLGSIHEEIASTGDLAEKYSYMSWLGTRLCWINIWTQIVTPIVFMFYLTGDKINKFILIGLIFALLNPILYSFNMGSRYLAVCHIYYLAYLFLLFNKFMNGRYKKYIRICLLFLCSFFFVVIAYITVGRFDSNANIAENTLQGWFFKYVGESFINFNGDMFWIDNYTNGLYTFGNFLQNLGFDLYGGFRGYEVLSNITHIRMHVFYTFIGNYFSDFGIFGASIIILILSVVYSKIIIIKNGVLSLDKLIIFCIYVFVLINGVTYFVFMNNAKSLFWAIGIAFLLKITNKPSIRINK